MNSHLLSSFRKSINHSPKLKKKLNFLSPNKDKEFSIDERIVPETPPNIKLFGSSLTEVLKTEQKEGLYSPIPKIPYIVHRLTEYIRAEGVDQEGLFRKNGNFRVRENLKFAFESTGDANLEEAKDIYSTASLLKQFLRELKEPLIPETARDEMIAARNKYEFESPGLLKSLNSILENLSKENYEVLKYILEFLTQVATHEAMTKMSPQSLAIVFVPSVFRSSLGIAGLKEQSTLSSLLTKLIQNSQTLFKQSRTDQGTANHRALQTSSPEQKIASSDTNSNNDVRVSEKSKSPEVKSYHGKVVTHPRCSALIADDPGMPSSSPVSSREVMSPWGARMKSPLSPTPQVSATFKSELQCIIHDVVEEFLFGDILFLETIKPIEHTLSSEKDKLKPDSLATTVTTTTTPTTTTNVNNNDINNNINKNNNNNNNNNNNIPESENLSTTPKTHKQGNRINVKSLITQFEESTVVYGSATSLPQLPSLDTLDDADTFERNSQTQLDRVTTDSSYGTRELIFPTLDRPKGPARRRTPSKESINKNISDFASSELDCFFGISTLTGTIDKSDLLRSPNNIELQTNNKEATKNISSQPISEKIKKPLHKSKPEVPANKPSLKVILAANSESAITNTAETGKIAANAKSSTKVIQVTTEAINDNNNNNNNNNNNINDVREDAALKTIGLLVNYENLTPRQLELLNELRTVKREIRRFQFEFRKSHGRKPSVVEREDIKPLILRYGEIKSSLSDLNTSNIEATQETDVYVNTITSPPPLVPVTLGDRNPTTTTTVDEVNNIPDEGQYESKTGSLWTFQIEMNTIANMLSEKRKQTGRSDQINAMSYEQLTQEKHDFQKALLSYENKYGRPHGEARLVMRPLYDKYRTIKQLLANHPDCKFFPIDATGVTAASMQSLATIQQTENTLNTLVPTLYPESLCSSGKTATINSLAMTGNYLELHKYASTTSVLSAVESQVNTIHTIGSYTPSLAVDDNSNTLREFSLVSTYLEFCNFLNSKTGTLKSQDHWLIYHYVRNKKRELKQYLLMFENEFQEKHSRKPEKSDREPMLTHYKEYRTLRDKIQYLERNFGIMTNNLAIS